MELEIQSKQAHSATKKHAKIYAHTYGHIRAYLVLPSEFSCPSFKGIEGKVVVGGVTAGGASSPLLSKTRIL